MKWDESYKVYRILHSLHENLSDSEFGFRIQGLFAHILIQLGVRILEIKPQGHPDIIGEVENQRIKLEVEAVIGKTRKRIIENEDIEAIKPGSKTEKGFIAILDCRLPLGWLIVNYERLRWRISESLSMVTLKSLCDKELSDRCTTLFFNLILSNASRLPRLTFSILREKALKGEELHA